MPLVQISAVNGGKPIHAHFYKGWALIGPNKTHVTHPTSGHLIYALDTEQEARRFVDLLALEKVDPTATPDELRANERLRMVIGYAASHSLMTGFWNGYIAGRPQPGSPYYRRWHTRRERQRPARLRRKRRQRNHR